LEDLTEEIDVDNHPFALSSACPELVEGSKGAYEQFDVIR